jgi:DNA (cytosine-5)-methyltransferase 1
VHKVLDLFAGAGGFALGFSLCKFDVNTHVEIDEYASKTLERNFPKSRVITDDIRFINVEKLKSENFKIIIGGPPCQGFSVAGSSQFGIQDDRNELVFWYLKYVQELRPRIAVIENVPNVLTKKSKDGESFLDLVKKIGSEMGYCVSYQVLNALHYGVPQSRRRAFIVLHSPYEKFMFPEITHDRNIELSLFEETKRCVTVGEALEDLPEVNVNSKNDSLDYKRGPQNEFQTFCRKNSVGIFNHEPMRHTARVVERFKIIKQGQSLKDVPMSHGQIAYGTGQKVEKPFKYNNYRLDSTKPSLTIPASYQSLFVHPFQDRNLTAREGARIMSFPDNYLFTGPKTMMSWESGLSQYNQIGNAVCPLVAMALGRAIKRYLKNSNSVEFTVNQSSTLKSISSNLKIHKYLIEDAKLNASKLKIKFLLKAEVVKSSSFYDQQTDQLIVGRVVVPILNVQFAYQLLIDTECKICNQDEAPFGSHAGSINLLKSKSDLKSLFSNKKDNGLDFHLRVFSGEDVRTVDEVARVLEDLDLAMLTSTQNFRTGKNVKTLTLKNKL